MAEPSGGPQAPGYVLVLYMSYNTNFIVNINGQNTDLGTLSYKWSTNIINIPASGTTLQSYSINYSSPKLIRETDIVATMDGQPVNGDQVYTFGPLIQNKSVVVGTSGTNYTTFSNDSVVFNGLGTSQANAAIIWDGIKWIGVNNITVSISYNGTNWQTVATLTAATGAATKINYNGKIYLISFYSSGGNNIAYSYDGINWNLTYSQISFTYAVTWNGSFWLGSGTTVTGNSFSFSPDGITWTGLGTLSASLGAVCWNGSYWVIIRDTRVVINTNPSGQGNWTTISNDIFPTVINNVKVFTIAWNGKTMIATGNSVTRGVGNTFAYSNDGINWTGLGPIIYQDTMIDGQSIWNGKVFINGYSSAITGNQFATSYNGMNWLGKGTSCSPIDIGINARRLNSVTFQRNMVIVTSATTNIMAYSYDGISWIRSPSSPFSTGCRTIAYNGKMWIAGGQGGNTLAFSYDGLNWGGLGASLFPTVIRKVIWNPYLSMWISVGGNPTNTFGYSYDGLTWMASSSTPFGSPTSFQSLDVACSKTIMIAVGGNPGSGGGPPTTMAYSYDGITWTAMNNNGILFCGFQITTNGYIWVASGQKVSASQNALAYSYNGIDWTQVSTFPILTTIVRDCCWNGYMFVAVGVGVGTSIAYSYNGINWYASTLSNGTYSSGFRVCWNGKMWLATFATASTALVYSYNGINWQTISTSGIFGTNNLWGLGTNYDINPMPFIQHPTLAFGSGNNTVAYSPDGITWTGLGTSVFSTQGYCGFWSGSIWLAGGQGGNTMAYSYDGIQWTGISNPFTTAVTGIAYNGNTWVAVGTGGNTVAYSTNRVLWTGSNLSDFTGGGSIFWNGTVFLITSGTSGNAYYSTTGSSWTKINPTNIVGFPASNGYTWVSPIGQSPGLLYINQSNPGNNVWTATATMFSTQGYCVCYKGPVWVAGGLGGNSIAFSGNGISWVGLGTTVFPNGCSSICWNGTRFVGGGQGYLGYSAQGNIWYSSPTSLFTSINDIVSNPGVGAFVAPSAMVLNNNGITGNGLYSSTTLEVVSSDPYFQNGFTNASFNITSNSIY